MWITNLHEMRVKTSKSSKTLTRSSTGKFASIVGSGWGLGSTRVVKWVRRREPLIEAVRVQVWPIPGEAPKHGPQQS